MSPMRRPPGELGEPAELIWFPGTCSRVTLIALEELELPFRTTTVPWGWANDAALLARNPKGKVPTLVTDDVVLTENPAILAYLHHHHPDSGLLPSGGLAVDIDVASTTSWFASGIHPLVARLRYPASVNDAPSSFARTRELASGRLDRCFALLEARLADRDWLYEEWSALDGYLLWLWFRAAGAGFDVRRYPQCADHAQRCEQRPSVARALDREEAEFARLIREGSLPVQLPPYQAGRAPRLQSVSNQANTRVAPV
jgi:glutathione S-transferase